MVVRGCWVMPNDGVQQHSIDNPFAGRHFDPSTFVTTILQLIRVYSTWQPHILFLLLLFIVFVHNEVDPVLVSVAQFTPRNITCFDCNFLASGVGRAQGPHSRWFYGYYCPWYLVSSLIICLRGWNSIETQVYWTLLPLLWTLSQLPTNMGETCRIQRETSRPWNPLGSSQLCYSWRSVLCLDSGEHHPNMFHRLVPCK